MLLQVKHRISMNHLKQNTTPETSLLLFIPGFSLSEAGTSLTSSQKNSRIPTGMMDNFHSNVVMLFSCLEETELLLLPQSNVCPKHVTFSEQRDSEHGNESSVKQQVEEKANRRDRKVEDR